MQRYLAVFFLSLISYQGLGQRNEVQFEHITIPGTMNSAMVEDIIQDPLGMIWIAKLVLHRYDGKKFKAYNTIYPDSIPLNGREITRLFWDSKINRLLIGTRNHGLLQFRYEDNRITRLPAALEVPFINNIAQTSDGKIWVTSFSNGLFSLENDTLKRKLSLQYLDHPSALAVNGLDLWVSSNGKINVLRDGEIIRIIQLENLTDDWKTANIVSSLLITEEGVWAGTDKYGAIQFDPVTLKTKCYFSPRVAPFFGKIINIQKDKEGLVWILTQNNGIDVYDPKLKTHLHLTHHSNIHSTISSDICASLLVDFQNIVWVGAAGALNKYDRHQIKFDVFRHDPVVANSLSNDNIRAIYESEDGIVWLATSDGRINLLNRNTRTSESIKVEVKGYNQSINPLYFCPLGKTMLIGSSHGVLEFNRKLKKFEFYKPLEQQTKGKTTRQVLRDNNLLYVQNQSNLLVFELDKNQLRKIDTTLTGVTYIGIDKNHFLWTGNLGGVSRYNPADNSIQKIKIEPENFRPDSSFFLVLHIDPSEKEVWVNTFNTGVFILSADKNGFYTIVNRLTTQEGLPDNTVYSSLSNNGDKWLSTNKGLALYKAAEKKLISFGLNEGLQDEEFNRLAFMQNKKGEMFFGGIKGLNIFHPDSLTITITNPRPQIIGANVFKNLSTDYPLGKYYSFINKEEIPQLKYSEKNLKFDFFIADYHEHNRYEIFYTLDPLDPEWNKSEDQNAAVYVNLKPGKYTFSVKTKNAENKELITSASFVIHPPFWNTWWFITLSVIGLFFLAIFIIQKRLSSIEAEQKRLASLLKIRTKEIEESKEELENLNRKKDLIFSILSHDLRSPLTTLKGFLDVLIDNANAISKEDLKKYSISIKNSVTNSLDLIDNTLYWSLSQTNTIQFNPTCVELDPIFIKIKGLYQLTADKKQIQLKFSSAEGITVKADENMFYVLLRNLVSNAIKFSPEGKSVSLVASRNSHWVEIRVKDEGIGMSKEEINKVFKLSNPQVKKGTGSEKGTGLGLLLCKKFIEINGGKLIIESVEGQGSEFIVTLPVNQPI